MRTLFQTSMLSEGINDFQSYLKSRDRDPIDIGEGENCWDLLMALEWWLIDGAAFKTVGDNYEFFLRIVIGSICQFIEDPTHFVTRYPYPVGQITIATLLNLGNLDESWLDPDFFRQKHYHYCEGRLDFKPLCTTLHAG